MPKFERLKFGTTPLARDGEVKAAYNELANAEVSVGKAMSNAGAQLQQKEVNDANTAARKQDNAFIAESTLAMNNQSQLFMQEYDNDEEGYRIAMDKFNSGILEKANDRTLQQLTIVGTEYSSKGFTNLQVARIGREEATAQADIQEVERINFETAIDYAVDGNIEGAHNAHDDFAASLQTRFESGDLSRKDQLIGLANFQTTLIEQAHYGVIDRFLANNDINGLENYLKQIDSTSVSMLGYDDLKPDGELFGDKAGYIGVVGFESEKRIKDYAYKSFNAYNTANRVDNTKKIQDSKQLLSSYKDLFVNGQSPTLDQINSIVAEAQTLGDTRHLDNVIDYANSWSVLTTAPEGEIPFADMTIRDMNLWIDAVEANPENAGQERTKELARQMIAAAENADQSYGVNKGWIEDGALTKPSEENPLNEQFARLSKNDITMREHLGLDYKGNYFSDADQKILQEEILKDPQITLSALVDGFGNENMERVIQELSLTDPVIGAAAIAFSEGDSKLGINIINGHNLRIENPTNFPKVDTIQSALAVKIGGIYGNTPVGSAKEKQLRSAIIASLTNMIATQRLESDVLESIADNGFTGFDDIEDRQGDNLLDAAIESVMGNIVDIELDDSGFWVDRDYKLPIPDGMDAGDVSDIIDGMVASDFVGVQQEIVDRILDNGVSTYQLVPSNLEDGGYIMYDSKKGGVITKEDGSPFIVNFDTLTKQREEESKVAVEVAKVIEVEEKIVAVEKTVAVIQQVVAGRPSVEEIEAKDEAEHQVRVGLLQEAETNRLAALEEVRISALADAERLAKEQAKADEDLRIAISNIDVTAVEGPKEIQKLKDEKSLADAERIKEEAQTIRNAEIKRLEAVAAADLETTRLADVIELELQRDRDIAAKAKAEADKIAEAEALVEAKRQEVIAQKERTRLLEEAEAKKVADLEAVRVAAEAEATRLAEEQKQADIDLKKSISEIDVTDVEGPKEIAKLKEDKATADADRVEEKAYQDRIAEINRLEAIAAADLETTRLADVIEAEYQAKLKHFEELRDKIPATGGRGEVDPTFTEPAASDLFSQKFEGVSEEDAFTAIEAIQREVEINNNAGVSTGGVFEKVTDFFTSAVPEGVSKFFDNLLTPSEEVDESIEPLEIEYQAFETYDDWKKFQIEKIQAITSGLAIFSTEITDDQIEIVLEDKPLLLDLLSDDDMKLTPSEKEILAITPPEVLEQEEERLQREASIFTNAKEYILGLFTDNAPAIVEDENGEASPYQDFDSFEDWQEYQNEITKKINDGTPILSAPISPEQVDVILEKTPELKAVVDTVELTEDDRKLLALVPTETLVEANQVVIDGQNEVNSSITTTLNILKGISDFFIKPVQGDFVEEPMFTIDTDVSDTYSDLEMAPTIEGGSEKLEETNGFVTGGVTEDNQILEDIVGDKKITNENVKEILTGFQGARVEDEVKAEKKRKTTANNRTRSKEFVREIQGPFMDKGHLSEANPSIDKDEWNKLIADVKVNHGSVLEAVLSTLPAKKIGYAEAADIKEQANANVQSTVLIDDGTDRVGNGKKSIAPVTNAQVASNTNSVRDILDFVPIIGDALMAKDVIDELNKEDVNWGMVGLNTGVFLVGLVPIVGDVAAKAIKVGAKKMTDNTIKVGKVSTKAEKSAHDLAKTNGGPVPVGNNAMVTESGEVLVKRNIDLGTGGIANVAEKTKTGFAGFTSQAVKSVVKTAKNSSKSKTAEGLVDDIYKVVQLESAPKKPSARTIKKNLKSTVGKKKPSRTKK